MDKRSFLAIAVTFVILLVWQMVFVAPQQKKAAERRERLRIEQLAQDTVLVGESAKPAEPDSGGAAVARGAGAVDTTVASGGFLAPGTGVREKTFSVKTKRMTVTLTTFGAEISGIELAGYSRKDGAAVRLIPEGARGAAAISIDNGAKWENLSALDFDVTVNGRAVEDGEIIDLAGEGQEAEVVFSRTGQGGERIEKEYTFKSEGYETGLAVEISREGELRNARGYSLSWESGLALNEKDVSGERSQLASLGKVGEDYFKEGVGKFGREGRTQPNAGMVSWAGAKTKYFLSALISREERSGALVMLGDKARDMVGYSVEFPFRGDPRKISDTFALFTGPLDMDALKAYGVGLEKTIDLGRMRFFSTFVLRLMMWMKKFIPNYGLIIIILSVLTKVLFYRLTHKSLKSMKDMQKLQPKLKELQEKYKNDKARLNQETMKMYKESGVNPLGGCLPLLLQLPVFLALFNVLKNTIELRNAPFTLWMNDLSSPDVLFGFGAKIPFLGSEFHLLPILMGVAMYVQSKMGGGEGVPASQTKMMTILMPVIFTFIFYSMPSGLVLYWLVNNILSIVQQYYVQKGIEKEEKTGKEAAQQAEPAQ